MNELQVIDLLGQPLQRQTEEDFVSERRAMGMSATEAFNDYWRNRHILAFQWLYGEIRYDSPVIPAPYVFDILFRLGAVIEKRDPFHGNLSLDGKPTTPRLLWPNDFERVPVQFVDLRWEPSAGEYPIQYEVEFSWATNENGRKVFQDVKPVRSRVPHLAVARVGANEHRWRVKAMNRLGESDWSSFRYVR